MLRKSIYRETERVTAATEDNIKGFYNLLTAIIQVDLGFYNLLTSTIQEYNLGPDQIHNIDESCIDMKISGKILAIKGTQYYHQLRSNINGHFTLVSTITADGRAMKHVLIAQGQSVPQQVLEKIQPFLAISATQNGWIDSEIKRSWFDLFLSYIQSKGNLIKSLFIC